MTQAVEVLPLTFAEFLEWDKHQVSIVLPNEKRVFRSPS